MSMSMSRDVNDMTRDPNVGTGKSQHLHQYWESIGQGESVFS